MHLLDGGVIEVKHVGELRAALDDESGSGGGEWGIVLTDLSDAVDVRVVIAQTSCRYVKGGTEQ